MEGPSTPSNDRRTARLTGNNKDTETMSSLDTLSELAARMGYREVPEVLAAVDLPLQRGHHIALTCGSGAGVDTAYALAVSRTCSGDGTAQALVLTAARGRAQRLAVALQRGLHPHGVRVCVPPLRSDGSVDLTNVSAHCLVERPSVLLPEVRLGRLHLGTLRLLVVDGLADLEDLDEWTSAEPLVDTLAPDTVRMATSRRSDESFQELVQRRLPRARRWPEDGDGPQVETEGRGGSVAVAVAASAPERLAILMDILAEREKGEGLLLRCRDEASVPAARAALESSGWSVGAAPSGWDLAAGGDEGSADAPGALCVWLGLPLSVEPLRQAGAGGGIAIVDVGHEAQLLLLAQRAGLPTRALPGLRPTVELTSLGRYRRMVRSRVERGGTDAELLVLDPVLREYGAARVAAALSSLLRVPEAVDPSVRPWADVEAATVGPQQAGGARAATPAPHRGTRAAWSRVFIGTGSRDSARAGDLVGAITGETGIAGAQIGKIEIRGSYSLVEIDSQVVDEVIRKLDGTVIRGRAVTVKRDRED